MLAIGLYIYIICILLPRVVNPCSEGFIMIHLPTRIPRPRDEHDNHAAIPVAGSGSVR